MRGIAPEDGERKGDFTARPIEDATEIDRKGHDSV